MQFLLVHSPLVGPTTWSWVAEALTTAGHDVVVPDLRAAAATGRPRMLIAEAVEAIPARWSTPVLVGHSGAGFVLPFVAGQIQPRQVTIVFVDAGLPPCNGRSAPSADFLDQLRVLAVHGVLPRWSSWWSERTMEMLISDADRRALLEAEMPEIPLAFYESPITVPVGWCDIRGSFLLLSDSYRQDADHARRLGWPVMERLGGHLDIVNDPESVARSIIELAA